VLPAAPIDLQTSPLPNLLTIDKLNRQPHLQGRQRLKPLADKKQKLYELQYGTALLIAPKELERRSAATF
jgi:hypothetical protein